uniref:THO complex subunit 7 homolog n=1 Tax=Prymnesium polylepis TaxID=72548 RepID=A0A7S4IFF2_9EUKA|mmetsp:Transcript_30982/g.76260  ORF Transcript_30982/g.76260 Transcript_30982/m.76260 type:complete len:189 (+) Transcript_30982:47-613(+)
MSADEEVLRQRLLAKENNLRNLTKRYLGFVNSIESSSTEDAQQVYQTLLKELSAYEFSVSKAGSLVDTNLRQIAEYDGMQQRIDAEMASTRADIDRLEVQLREERVLRQQKEQYAVLARRINAYPARDQTQAEIGALNAEIGALKREGDVLGERVEQRSKRFAGFMHSLHDLQLQLAEETAAGGTANE